MEDTGLRHDVASGELRTFDNARTTRDAGRLSGGRLEIWREAGTELPESVLPQHALTMVMGPTDTLEVSFAGEPWRRGLQQPGVVCLVPAGVPYRVRRLRQSARPAQMIVLGLDPSFMASALGARRSVLTPSFGAPDAVVSSLLGALANEATSGHPSGELYGESLLVALAAHLGRGSVQRFEAVPNRVRDFIHARLGEPLSLVELAEFSNTDVRSFTRWFRTRFGTSPHQYISAARVERAKERLKRSTDALGIIAFECGFSSQSHFTTMFRQLTGVTPAAYRQQFKTR